MPPISTLDLAFVPEGGTPVDAFRNTLDLAQHAERWVIGAQINLRAVLKFPAALRQQLVDVLAGEFFRAAGHGDARRLPESYFSMERIPGKAEKLKR